MGGLEAKGTARSEDITFTCGELAAPIKRQGPPYPLPQTKTIFLPICNPPTALFIRVVRLFRQTKNYYPPCIPQTKNYLLPSLHLILQLLY